MWIGESHRSRKTSLEIVAVGKVRDDWDLEDRVCFEDLEKEGVMRSYYEVKASGSVIDAVWG